jgi:hypothetical protein
MRGLKKMRVLVLVALLAMLGAACASETDTGDDTGDDEELSLALGSVPDGVLGNVVTLPVTIKGVEIVKPDGDTSGDTGHFHVFVDGDPAAVGDTIPRERGVVHSADNPIKVWGLRPGEHEFTVVVGDGTHKRIHEELEDSVTVDVEGPSVWGTPTVDGDDVTIALESEDVDIKAADGSTSKESGHFHVLVDPATPPTAGGQIAEAEEGKIYHSAEDELEIKNLEKGEHIIWIVLGDGTHKAFDPAVMDKLTVTIE